MQFHKYASASPRKSRKLKHRMNHRRPEHTMRISKCVVYSDFLGLRFPRLLVFSMIAICMCFGGLNGVQGVYAFGEFVYFEDPYVLLHVVLYVL